MHYLEQTKSREKSRISRFFEVFFVCLVALAFIALSMVYTQPSREVVYFPFTNEASPRHISSDSGWFVYIQTGVQKTELFPGENGSSFSLPEPGQTLYCSRILVENIPGAQLRIETGSRNISIFLDEKLIYSDFPGEPQRIGDFSLPMREAERAPVFIQLPEGYMGHILTIAQSTDPQESVVFPCGVTLYGRNAYSRLLVSDSFRTAWLFSIFSIIGSAFLAGYLYRGRLEKADPPLLLIAVTLLLSAGALLIYSPDFSAIFVSARLPDFQLPARSLCVTVFFIVFAFRSPKSVHRAQFIAMAILQGVLSVLTTLYRARLPLLMKFSSLDELLPSWTALVFMLYSFALCVLQMNGPRAGYFRFYCIFTAGFFLLCSILAMAWEGIEAFIASLGFISFDHIEPVIHSLFVVQSTSIIVTEVFSWVHFQRSIYEERILIREKGEMAMSSYRSMAQQRAELMMQQHDFKRHLYMLRRLEDPQKVNAYLDELIEQSETSRSVVQSGNEMIDIILSGKLAEATAQGIQVKVEEAHAPSKLPLSDVQLSSLLLNIMDNAIHAAGMKGVENPSIVLRMRLKNGFFVFSCENSCLPGSETEKTDPSRAHGWGLPIIRRILQQYEDSVTIEQQGNQYQVIFALPVIPPPRKSEARNQEN